jgi:cytoskeletal protein RodZ
VTLGQLFKQKRQESGRSLEQLAALTKIHIKILSALEEDTYTHLPARAFTRGFIVNYAKALKMNPDEVLKDHQEFLEARFSERIDRDKGHQGYVFEGKELEQNKRWLYICGSIAGVFALAFFLVFKPGNHKHKEQHKEFEEETQLDANGEPVESTPAPPTLKGTPMQVIPYAPIEPLAASTPATTSSVAYNASPAAPVIPLGSPAANALAVQSPIASPSSSPSKASTPVPTPHATPAVTPAPSVAKEAEVVASPTPAAKEDKLNKGDALDPKEVKIKANFQAKEDLWVRYRSDDKPIGMLILRKDRYLVIKAKSKLLFETLHPENIRYKSKSGYIELTLPKAEISPNGSLNNYSGDSLGSAPMPETVPLPASH